MRVLGVIPARGGSKRIPRKNLRLLCGRPLIQYSIEAARKATKLTTWVLSTEDEEIRDVALSLGAYVVRRPDELALDKTTTGSVLKHVLEWMAIDTEPYDIVVCLHPTSPIRDPKDIDIAIKCLENDAYNCVASCCALPIKSHPNVFPEDGGPSFGGYILNGSIYAIRSGWLKKTGKHVSHDPMLMPMDRRHSLDIDEELDFQIAELLLNGTN